MLAVKKSGILDPDGAKGKKLKKQNPHTDMHTNVLLTL